MKIEFKPLDSLPNLGPMIWFLLPSQGAGIEDNNKFLDYFYLYERYGNVKTKIYVYGLLGLAIDWYKDNMYYKHKNKEYYDKVLGL